MSRRKSPFFNCLDQPAACKINSQDFQKKCSCFFAKRLQKKKEIVNVPTLFYSSCLKTLISSKVDLGFNLYYTKTYKICIGRHCSNAHFLNGSLLLG